MIVVSLSPTQRAALADALASSPDALSFEIDGCDVTLVAPTKRSAFALLDAAVASLDVAADWVSRGTVISTRETIVRARIVPRKPVPDLATDRFTSAISVLLTTKLPEIYS